MGTEKVQLVLVNGRNKKILCHITSCAARRIYDACAVLSLCKSVRHAQLPVRP